jgi:Leucine-rich repeat (LRR) protein
MLNFQVVLLHTNNLQTLKHGGSIEDLSLVKFLDVHDNKLTSLPANLGGMAALHTLNLEGNRLKELPNSIGNLKALEALYAKCILHE